MKKNSLSEQDKRDIEIECQKIMLGDLIVHLPPEFSSDKNFNMFIEHIQEDDKHNKLILAIQRAITLTENKICGGDINGK